MSRSGPWPLFVALVFGMTLACGRPPAETLRPGAEDRISIDVIDVPLNPQNPSETALGNFSYVGGFAMTSSETDRLRGLSDVEVVEGNRLTAVGDFGTLLEARLVLDAAGRLTGIAEARLTPLLGLDGDPVPDKTEGDAEGLAILPGGDRLVSFERRQRVWLYPAAGGPPHPVPSPQVALPENSGLEAITADPDSGADTYIVGAERSGATWVCQVSGSCVEGVTLDKPEDFGLVAIRRLPGNRTAYLLRAFDDIRGSRILLRIVGEAGLLDWMELARPLTVDNFEGLAVVPLSDGAFKFFLLSDDNDNASQRTLLLAFVWHPTHQSVADERQPWQDISPSEARDGVQGA